jgi:hypothetical protein
MMTMTARPGRQASRTSPRTRQRGGQHNLASTVQCSDTGRAPRAAARSAPPPRGGMRGAAIPADYARSPPCQGDKAFFSRSASGYPRRPGASMPPDASFATFVFPGRRAMPVLLTLLFPGRANRAAQEFRLVPRDPHRTSQQGSDRDWASGAAARRPRHSRHCVSSSGPTIGIVASTSPGMTAVALIGAVIPGKRLAAELERRRVATGANHPASHSSALRRGPGTPATVPRRGTRAPVSRIHRKPSLAHPDRITKRISSWTPADPADPC